MKKKKKLRALNLQEIKKHAHGNVGCKIKEKQKTIGTDKKITGPCKRKKVTLHTQRAKRTDHTD